MKEYLNQLHQPLPSAGKKKKCYSSSSSSSDDSDNSSSSDAEENEFYCRFCNKKAKGIKERKPENEVCSTCVINFPSRMFCKTCKRFYPDKKPFAKSKDRCNYCFEKLMKAREARKKRKEGVQVEVPEKKIKKQQHQTNDDENYICLYVKGQCVFKKHFAI